MKTSRRVTTRDGKPLVTHKRAKEGDLETRNLRACVARMHGMRSTTIRLFTASITQASTPRKQGLVLSRSASEALSVGLVRLICTQWPTSLGSRHSSDDSDLRCESLRTSVVTCVDHNKEQYHG